MLDRRSQLLFDLYIARYALADLPDAELSAAATQGLIEGLESSTLAALAGSTLEERGASQLHAMWREALEQLGKEPPTRAKAGLLLRDHYARSVLAGEISPQEGAFAIVQLCNEVRDVFPEKEYVGDSFGVAHIYGLYYSHDDIDPMDERARHEIDEEIKSRCAALVN